MSILFWALASDCTGHIQFRHFEERNTTLQYKFNKSRLCSLVFAISVRHSFDLNSFVVIT